MSRACAGLFAAVLVTVVAAAVLATPSARADAIIEQSIVENGYPKTLTFKLTARADVEITDVALSYRITGRGTSAIAKPDEFTPGRSIGTAVELQVNSSTAYIPVGSEFTYAWEITTADGKVTSGPDEKFFYLPPGKEWKSVSNEILTVYYHGDRETLANAFLRAGLATYERIGKELLKTELRQLPVKVILFADEAEMDPARPGAGQGTFDAAVTTCGTKVTNDIVLVIPVSCGTPDRTDTFRHEFGHIINQAAGEGPLGKLPAWIDEGTAVLAQSEPGDNYVGAFQAAARANRLIPFSQMGTPSADPGRVNLFYGQSYHMVLHLLEKGGPEKFAEFFATIKRGARFDAALQQVYGFDLAGFEREFLAANGATAPTAAPTQRPRQQATAAPTQRPQQNQATRTATRAPAAATSDDDDDDGLDPIAIGIIGAAVVFGLLGVFFFLVAQLMANRRPSAPGSGPGA